MFKYLVFAVLLAFVAADPKPEPKPGYLAAPLTAPLAYTPQAYISPYTAYTAPFIYNNQYRYNGYNNGYPYAYNYYY